MRSVRAWIFCAREGSFVSTMRVVPRLFIFVKSSIATSCMSLSMFAKGSSAMMTIGAVISARAKQISVRSLSDRCSANAAAFCLISRRSIKSNVLRAMRAGGAQTSSSGVRPITIRLSEPSLMAALFGDRRRPLFEQARSIALGPLPLAELADWIAFSKTWRHLLHGGTTWLDGLEDSGRYARANVARLVGEPLDGIAELRSPCGARAPGRGPR